MKKSYWLTKYKHLAFDYAVVIFGPLDQHKINATSMFYVIDLLHNAQMQSCMTLTDMRLTEFMGLTEKSDTTKLFIQ